MLKFKVELELSGATGITVEYFAENLQDLQDKIKTEFPKAKVISIIGGGQDYDTDGWPRL